jgi:uncharacterized protein YgiM (DUF1202 family)
MSEGPLRSPLRLLALFAACVALGLGCATTQPDQKAPKKEGTPPPAKAAPPDTAAYQEKAVFAYPAVVVNRRINLRAGPGTSYAVVESLSGGQGVTVVSESGEWVKVLVDRDNRMGWIHRSLIRRKR